MLRRLIVLVVAVLPVIAMAKRTSDYVAPPYGARLVYASLGLLLLSLPVTASVALAARVTGADWGRRVSMSLLAIVGTVLIGAMIAALDGLNDEGWNPAFFGSPFVAFALPMGLYFALPPTPSRSQTLAVVSAGAAVIGIIVVAALGGEILQWAHARGWPVMW